MSPIFPALDAIQLHFAYAELFRKDFKSRFAVRIENLLFEADDLGDREFVTVRFQSILQLFALGGLHERTFLVVIEKFLFSDPFQVLEVIIVAFPVEMDQVHVIFRRLFDEMFSDEFIQKNDFVRDFLPGVDLIGKDAVTFGRTSFKDGSVVKRIGVAQ